MPPSVPTGPALVEDHRFRRPRQVDAAAGAGRVGLAAGDQQPQPFGDELEVVDRQPGQLFAAQRGQVADGE
ncbi:hypothetical protein WEI85_23970 [Actinomycetes bacterium KLBMP 9797]